MERVDKFLVAVVVVIVTAVVAVLAFAAYYAATGGFTYSERQKIGGVTCIVIHNRFTGAPDHVSCPVVKP